MVFDEAFLEEAVCF